MAPSNLQTDFMITTASVTAGNVITDAVLRYGPGTSGDYIDKGGNLVDQSARMLLEKVGPHEDSDFLIEEIDRRASHLEAEHLNRERRRLQKQTDSFSGSVKNWPAARQFYKDAEQFHLETKALSGESLNKHGMSKTYPPQTNVQSVQTTGGPAYASSNSSAYSIHATGVERNQEGPSIMSRSRSGMNASTHSVSAGGGTYGQPAGYFPQQYASPQQSAYGDGPPPCYVQYQIPSYLNPPKYPQQGGYGYSQYPPYHAYPIG